MDLLRGKGISIAGSIRYNSTDFRFVGQICAVVQWELSLEIKADANKLQCAQGRDCN
jgi:hypothetical protein